MTYRIESVDGVRKFQTIVEAAAWQREHQAAYCDLVDVRRDVSVCLDDIDFRLDELGRIDDDAVEQIVNLLDEEAGQ